MNALTFLFALALLVWLWQNNLRFREFAVQKCKTVCRDMDLQLLDETVAMHKFSISSDNWPEIKILRCYQFEFSLQGHDRHAGSITFLGQAINHIQLDHPDGQIILYHDGIKKLH